MSSVEGTVTLDGRPLETGKVVFIPQAGGPSAEGEIQSDGSFRLKTPGKGDGAAIGSHQAIVVACEKPVWPPAYDKRDLSQPSRSLIPRRYSNSSSSGLSFEVAAGNNDFAVELKSK